jgi:hypothetical protein
LRRTQITVVERILRRFGACGDAENSFVFAKKKSSGKARLQGRNPFETQYRVYRSNKARRRSASG